MTLKLFAGLALACVALSGCGTMSGFGTPSAGSAGGQLTSTLDSINAAVGNNCQVDAHLTLAPPLPPMGSANISCSPRGAPIAPK